MPDYSMWGYDNAQILDLLRRSQELKGQKGIPYGAGTDRARNRLQRACRIH